MSVKYQETIHIFSKHNDQLQFIDIIQVSMVSTPEIFTDNSPMSPGPPMILRNHIARKSIYLFTEVLDVKNKLMFAS